MSSPERLGAMILLPVIVTVGVAVSVGSARRIWFYRHSLLWTRTAGLVTCSEIVEDDDDGRWFIPRVEYSYEVGGQSFRSHSLNFGFYAERYRERKEAEARAARYPVGARITVAHHPAHPARSVLERRLDRGIYAMLGFGLFMTLCGIWAFTEIVVLKR